MKRIPLSFLSFLLFSGLLALTALLSVDSRQSPDPGEIPSTAPDYSPTATSTATRALSPVSAPEPAATRSPEDRLFALLSRVGTDPSVMRPVQAWYRHGRKAPITARGIAAIPPGLLLGYEKGNAVRLALPGGREASGIVHTVAAPGPD